MSDVSNYQIALDNQLFFINSTPVAGVQSIGLDSASNFEIAKYLGQSKYKFYANGIQGGRVTIDHLVVSDDVFLPYTGDYGFNGYIIKNRADTSENYSFASGYLSSYSVKGGIDNPIQVSVGVDVFGPVGTLTSSDHSQISTDFSNITNHSYVEPDYKFAHPQYTTVSCDNVTNNRLQGFEINIEVLRSPVYFMGNLNPSHVETKQISINCSMQYEIDSYTMTKSRNKSSTHTTSDITITLKTKSGSTIQTYSYNSMELINENYSSQNNGNALIDAEYQTYI